MSELNSEPTNDDVALNAFLQLLEKDIMENPQNLSPLTQERFEFWDKLTKGVGPVDLDAPLLDEDEDF